MKKEFNKEKAITIINDICSKKNYKFEGFKDDYINQNSKIILICNVDNYKWETTFYNFYKKGSKCHRCTKHEMKSESDIIIKIKKRCSENNFEFIDFKNKIFRNTREKIILKCEKEHIWTPSIDNFLNKNTKCLDCLRNPKLSIEVFNYNIDKQTNINNHTFLKIIDNFNYCNTKIQLNCNTCNNIWNTIYSVYILRPSKCKKCLNIKKLTREEANYRIELKCFDRKYTFLGFENNKYVNLKTYIYLKCSKNHDWKMSCLNLFHSNNGCPICKESKGEVIIRKYLSDNNIEFNSQKMFEGCKNKRRLKFDFYLPKLNICIEFDGQQHFTNVKFNGSKSDLSYVQNNDKIKNEYCQNNNIRLLRISFLDKNRINEILDNYLRLS